MSTTWGQLKNEVLALGFENDAVYDSYKDSFIIAANAALDILSETVRPLEGRITIYQQPPENLLGSSTIASHNAYGSPTYSAAGVSAYYFECDGNGTAVLNDDNGRKEIVLSSNGAFLPYRGFASGSLTLSFEGDFDYNIRAVAMYGRLKGNTIDDIPQGGERAYYDMNRLAGDNFAGLIGQGVSVKGGVNAVEVGCEITDGIISLPSDFEGEIEIRYRRRHKRIDTTTPDDEIIELSDGLSPLLPLLMANRVWLDDDERKATYYWNSYEILLSRLNSGTESEFINERGW